MLVYRCFCLTADNRVIGRAHIDAADVGIAVEMAARATASLHRGLGGQRVAASGGSYSTQTPRAEAAEAVEHRRSTERLKRWSGTRQRKNPAKVGGVPASHQT